MLAMVRLILTSGLTLMVLSAFFFALTDVLIKFVSPAIAATEIAFFRFLIGAVILLSLMVPRGITLRGKNPFMLIVRAVSGTLCFLFLVKSISLIPLSTALVLFYTFPLFAAFFSFLLFRESLGGLEIILILVGFVGIYIVIDPGSHVFNQGGIYGLLAGCFAGFTVVLIRKLRETHDPLIIYFYFCLVGGIVCFPFFLKEFTRPSFEQLSLLILLGLVFLIAQLLMNQGFKFCKASEGSVILMSEIVFAGVAGVIIFKDDLHARFLIGALLIVGSGFGLNLRNRRLRLMEVSTNKEKDPRELPSE